VSRSRREILWLAALGSVSLACPRLATALKCDVPDFERNVLAHANVIAGEIMSVKRKDGRPERYRVAILARLKDGGLFPADKRRFDLPAFTGFDLLRYKKGQVVLFFFNSEIAIKCNYPVVVG